MEIIKWASNKGITVKLTDDEAKHLSRQLEDPQVTVIILDEFVHIEIGGYDVAPIGGSEKRKGRSLNG